jgi:hypothetical protein
MKPSKKQPRGIPFSTQRVFRPPSPYEINRLYELLFINMTKELFVRYQNQPGVYRYYAACCGLFKIDYNMVHQCLDDLINTLGLMPSRKEMTMLLYRSRVPLRRIVHLTHFSTVTIYEIINEYLENPYEVTTFWSEERDAVLIEFIQKMHSLEGLV